MSWTRCSGPQSAHRLRRDCLDRAYRRFWAPAASDRRLLHPMAQPPRLSACGLRKGETPQELAWRWCRGGQAAGACAWISFGGVGRIGANYQRTCIGQSLNRSLVELAKPCSAWFATYAADDVRAELFTCGGSEGDYYLIQSLGGLEHSSGFATPRVRAVPASCAS